MIKNHHFPNPPASNQEINSWIRRTRLQLPEQIANMYLQFNGASLFRTLDPPMRIVKLDELLPTREVMYGRTDPELGDAATLAFIALHDGNFVALRIAENSEYFLLDAFHETFWEDWKNPIVISEDMSRFLDRAIDSAGDYFWL